MMDIVHRVPYSLPDPYMYICIGFLDTLLYCLSAVVRVLANFSELADLSYSRMK